MPQKWSEKGLNRISRAVLSADYDGVIKKKSGMYKKMFEDA